MKIVTVNLEILVPDDYVPGPDMLDDMEDRYSSVSLHSIEKFLENPSILRWHEKIDPNFKWMHTVTPQSSLYNWGPPVFCLFFSDSAFGSFVNIYTANVGKITNSKSVISAYIYEPK